MTLERASYHRMLRNSLETLSMQWYLDGAAVDPGVTTIGILNDAGTTVVASGTATSGTTTSPRTYALAAQANVDILTVNWTSATYGLHTTYAEIVGEHLFTIADARAAEGGMLASTTDYPQATLEKIRARISDAFERRTGVSFFPRYNRAVLDGNGKAYLDLADVRIRTIRAIETRASGGTTWTAYTAAELADVFYDDTGRIERETLGTFTRGRQNVRVTYEYGWPRVPWEIQRAGLKVLTSTIGAVRSNLPERARSLSDETGTFLLSTPGERGSWFGIPEVDEILHAYDERRPGMA